MIREAERDAVLDALVRRPLVMGILNVTPDSFSDGGRFDKFDAAQAQAQRMIGDGADILDIGGESTRPGSDPVSEEDERARVIPVLKALSDCGVPLSIDTYKSAIAREAVDAGAVIVNDVWGMQRDPDMPRVVAETSAAVVLMHNREQADPNLDIFDDVRRFLERSVTLAGEAGVPDERILVDPGIGFGKTPEQSLTCIAKLDRLIEWFGRPVLLGLSRKRFIGHVTGAEVGDRLAGTLAANMMGLARGASVLRVHDVAEHVHAVKMHLAVRGAT